jgi:chromosome segregation ATPase
MSPSYRLPIKQERALEQRVKAAECRLATLLSDSNAGAVIAQQDSYIASLKADHGKYQTTIDALKSKNGNLTQRCRELTEANRTQRKEIAALRWDVQVAHSVWQESERKWEKCEKRRYEWATFAREVTEKLASVRASVRVLKAQLNRTSDNSSLPPSLCSNKKKIVNLREKTARKVGGQVGHKGHSIKRQVPDEVRAFRVPCVCPGCKGALVATGKEKRRQLVDVAVTLYTTEFTGRTHTCVA